MTLAKPLPTYLADRYQGWKSDTYAQNTAFFQKQAEGQSPRAMVISCCDSRVHPTSLFEAKQGELFIHRNIANFVPPYADGSDNHGTAAAVEYAVTALKVSHIVVLGHSSCGGVAGCVDLCEGKAPGLDDASSFVGRWIKLLRPGYERVKGIEDEADRKRALEKEAVLLSVENLSGLPFVKSAMESGQLTLHALWTHIGDGTLEHCVDGKTFTQI